MDIGKYKGILGVFFGAMLTGIISLSVALYNTQQQYDLLSSKERRAELSSQINILKFVEKDLTRNMGLLLNKSYTASIRTEPFKKSISLPEANTFLSKEEMETMKGIFAGFINSLKSPNDLDYLILKECVVPKSKFSIRFHQRIYEMDDVSFSLRDDLLGLYDNLLIANESIDVLKTYPTGWAMPSYQLNTWKRYSEQLKTSIEEISQNSLASLQDRVKEEIRNLEETLRKYPKTH